jgi:Cdc6-like AAA superfamily ATPase
LHECQDNRERHEEHQAILDWLTPIDYAPQQSDFIARRQEGTGQWLLNSGQFREWLTQGKQTLFCPGMPGAGKTMIASIVVDHLCGKFFNDANIGIAYLYCNFRQQEEQKPMDLFLSVLKQLLQERPSMPETVKSLYDSHKDKRTRPSFNEILKLLYSVVANYSRAFIIIDALDECRVSDRPDADRKKLVSEIFNLQVKTGASLFATSRFIPEIIKEFEGSLSLEICASDADVQKYVDGCMPQLPSFVLRNLDLQEEIKTEIVKAVDGMYGHSLAVVVVRAS